MTDLNHVTPYWWTHAASGSARIMIGARAIIEGLCPQQHKSHGILTERGPARGYCVDCRVFYAAEIHDGIATVFIGPRRRPIPVRVTYDAIAALDVGEQP